MPGPRWKGKQEKWRRQQASLQAEAGSGPVAVGQGPGRHAHHKQGYSLHGVALAGAGDARNREEGLLGPHVNARCSEQVRGSPAHSARPCILPAFVSRAQGLAHTHRGGAKNTGLASEH